MLFAKCIMRLNSIFGYVSNMCIEKKLNLERLFYVTYFNYIMHNI